MKERKNIDRLFQEKFKDFEGHPREKVWESIQAELQSSNSQKSWIHSVWSRAVGIAAALVIFFLVGDWLSTNPSSQVATQKSEQQDQGHPEPPSVENFAIAEIDETKEVPQLEREPKPDHDPPKQPPLEVVHNASSLKTSGINPFHIAAIFMDSSEPSDGKYTHPADQELTGISLFEAIKDQKTEHEVQQLGKGKLIVTTQAAPVFIGNMGRGNFLDSKFNTNPSETGISFAYGVNVAYAISDKIKVRSGINKVTMSYSTSDVPYRTAMNPAAIRSISFNSDIKERAASIASEGPIQYMSANASKRAAGSLNQASINQKLGYIEIPVELQYNLLNKKIEINIIGGGSTLFLDENAVSLEHGQEQTQLGKANNLNTVSFSTNIGLGVDYKLTEKFKLNLEPMFKYQLNTFSSDANLYRPYFLGIYSGFSFEF